MPDYSELANTIVKLAEELQGIPADEPARNEAFSIPLHGSEHAGVLMVANASDPLPPQTPAKLFVTNVEWRKLAFALISEAAAIVLILRAEELSQGVADEIRAILALGRAPHTAIVFNDAGETDEVMKIIMVDATPPADPGELATRLNGMGFPHVFAQSAFLERPWELVSGIAESGQFQAGEVTGT